MKSIEKLRTAARNMAKGRNLEHHEECNLLLRIADEIEAEIAERYMELPTDADGVPIHVGDKLYYEHYGQTFTVGVIEHGHSGLAFVRDCPNGSTWKPSECRHVKPRTIEDVLRDCCNEWNEHCGNDWEQSVYAKYADEIRGLL